MRLGEARHAAIKHRARAPQRRRVHLARRRRGGNASAYRYLLQGIRALPSAPQLAQGLQALSFEAVAFERLSLGIVAIRLGMECGLHDFLHASQRDAVALFGSMSARR